ncbi:hypothetical protein [Aneurinibacillus uraniidurans]|uniref:hypothetical protein n=1 Tax=Aneurinibacillus uraniidurans TaxID=2966586 RepID=UPI00234B41B2|nr:hypothetical protein [Aneurinibacillus sp. B1]WCN39295.1 hypothetical protein PO771_07855 [Aneurinibacillus sp. B1]
MHDPRKCENCWWICGNTNQCLFLEELQQLQKTPKQTVCWGWRPIETEERHAYLASHGREVDRIGRLPVWTECL